MASKDIEFKAKGVRLSFENLFVPKAYKNKKTGEIESYAIEAAFLLDKETQADLIKQGGEAMKQALANRWPDNPPTITADRRCFSAGEVVDPDTGEKKERYTGYAGQVVLNAKKRVPNEQVGPNGRLLPGIENPVQLLGPRKTAKRDDGTPCFPRLNGSEGLLYSGAYVDVIVRIYAYDGAKDGNPHRINASLEAVKFVRHGDAFGAKKIDADSAFDEEDGDEDDGMGGSPAAASKTSAADPDDLMG